MSEKAPEGTGSVRQFRVTITESPLHASLRVRLAWRTFPCTAEHWDGFAEASVLGLGQAITSQEALREVLGALAAQPWETSRLHRP